MHKSIKLVIFDWHGTLVSSWDDFFPNAISTLKQLKQEGYLLAVATSMPYGVIKQIIDKHNLPDLFATIRTASQTANKPNPKMLNEILTELTISPKQAVMIGDTEADMAMAKRAGVPAIAVAYGLDSTEALKRHAIKGVIQDIADLPMVINKSDFI